ncbi:MAG TPA: CbtB domain-containing protein [Candidatus Binataceae bacterium]|nr:CbtB domain-containing protein [Candidatus Binataceae bacterium]
MVNENLAVLNLDKLHAGARTGIGVASKAIVAAMAAIALGSAILFVVGFSHGELIHAAAHDVRHATGFPCH